MWISVTCTDNPRLVSPDLKAEHLVSLDNYKSAKEEKRSTSSLSVEEWSVQREVGRDIPSSLTVIPSSVFWLLLAAHISYWYMLCITSFVFQRIQFSYRDLPISWKTLLNLSAICFVSDWSMDAGGRSRWSTLSLPGHLLTPAHLLLHLGLNVGKMF